MRAQTSLPALGFALLLLTGVLVLGVAVADGALLDADRSALQRQAAVDLSDRLVAADAPLTERANVLNATAVADLDAATLRTRYGVPDQTAFEVTLDGTTLAAAGTVDDGTTVTRLVVVQETSERTFSPSFPTQNRVTLPRRTDRATLTIRPRSGTTVTTVRANDRVVLHDESGLRGTFDVSLSPTRTTQFSFEASALLSTGSVDITYYPATTEKARLAVTVDA